MANTENYSIDVQKSNRIEENYRIVFMIINFWLQKKAEEEHIFSIKLSLHLPKAIGRLILLKMKVNTHTNRSEKRCFNLLYTVPPYTINSRVKSLKGNIGSIQQIVYPSIWAM